MDENEVWVNADAAERAGSARATACASGTRTAFSRTRSSEGHPGDPHRLRLHGPRFGQPAKGLRRALGKGASDAQLVTRYETDPLMGGTGMNVNFVTLEREA